MAGTWLLPVGSGTHAGRGQVRLLRGGLRTRRRSTLGTQDLAIDRIGWELPPQLSKVLPNSRAARVGTELRPGDELVEADEVVTVGGERNGWSEKGTVGIDQPQLIPLANVAGDIEPMFEARPLKLLFRRRPEPNSKDAALVALVALVVRDEYPRLRPQETQEQGMRTVGNIRIEEVSAYGDPAQYLECFNLAVLVIHNLAVHVPGMGGTPEPSEVGDGKAGNLELLHSEPRILRVLLEVMPADATSPSLRRLLFSTLTCLCQERAVSGRIFHAMAEYFQNCQKTDSSLHKYIMFVSRMSAEEDAMVARRALIEIFHGMSQAPSELRRKFLSREIMVLACSPWAGRQRCYMENPIPEIQIRAFESMYFCTLGACAPELWSDLDILARMVRAAGQAQSVADENSSTWASSSPLAFRDIWHRWRPGWYFLIFFVNALGASLLLPGGECEPWCENTSLWHYRICFSGLMLASLGSGCVAAFLKKRAGASAHVRSASGYAIINWLQSILGTTSLYLSDGVTYYGIIPVQHANGETPKTFRALIVFRGLLYMIASFWMQKLIASRLDLLEQSSHQKFCSGCIRRLLRVQACTATLTALLVCVWVVLVAIMNSDSFFTKARCPAAMAGLTAFFNVLANIVAACSLTKSFLLLRRILGIAKLKAAPPAARLSLGRARRFAALQTGGISFSLVLTILVIPCIVLGNIGNSQFGDLFYLDYVVVSVQAMDVLGNALAVLLLSGGHRLSKVEQAPGLLGCWACSRQTKAPPEQAGVWSPTWRAKVEELSLRGMTLRNLLLFYDDELPSMPGWKFAPKEHRTRDVVRRAIIPLTSREESAYAASALNRDGPQRAQVMVTHNWGNFFNDLLAAVVSDALGECSFRMVSQLLEEDCAFLTQILARSGRLDDTYWICAFAVNQHISICHSNPYDRDPLTNELHPVCTCSSVNISDPDGRSTISEINKFDDMMYHLATTGICRQVIAVDKQLDLFHRAWCVAEIAEAKRLDMIQSLKLLSKATIQQRARTLEDLDVRSMNASSAKDKELILRKIKDIDEFNAELRALIFDPKSGLVASWFTMDSLQQVGEVGRLIRWGLADAGTGKVWKVWEAVD
eukprot:Skav204379  [mRNA]  locus=scaffold4897:143966:157568:- [translate_table: standard]